MRLYSLPLTLSLLAAILTLSSCKKAQVRVYDVPKQQASQRTQSPSQPASTAQRSGSVVWQKAGHWEELPPTAFRKGNYRHQSETGVVEITVSSFPGDTGGLLANVNRWLGQAGQSPIAQRELIDLIETKTISGSPITMVDLNPQPNSPTATRIYAAILMHTGQSWFFKMSGPSTDVQTQVPAFDSMIDGLTLATSEQSSNAIPTPAATESGTLTFTPPEDWQPSKGSAMRIASYQIPMEGFTAADFSITAFPGDTGGTLANVNRWRRQIGLATWTNAEVAQNEKTLLAQDGLKFLIYDLKPITSEADSKNNDRILVAILGHADKSWFFKLKGDAFLLETQRAKFHALLKTVHFHKEGDSHNH